MVEDHSAAASSWGAAAVAAGPGRGEDIDKAMP